MNIRIELILLRIDIKKNYLIPDISGVMKLIHYTVLIGFLLPTFRAFPQPEWLIFGFERQCGENRTADIFRMTLDEDNVAA